MSSAASLKRGGKQDAVLLLRGKIKVCFAATASSKLQPAPRPHRTRVRLWKASTNVDNVLVCWSTQSHDVTRWGWPYRWVVKSAAGGRSFPSDRCLVAKRQSLIWKEEKKKKREISAFRNRMWHKHWRGVMATGSACCFIARKDRSIAYGSTWQPWDMFLKKKEKKWHWKTTDVGRFPWRRPQCCRCLCRAGPEVTARLRNFVLLLRPAEQEARLQCRSSYSAMSHLIRSDDTPIQNRILMSRVYKCSAVHDCNSPAQWHFLFGVCVVCVRVGCELLFHFASFLFFSCKFSLSKRLLWPCGINRFHPSQSRVQLNSSQFWQVVPSDQRRWFFKIIFLWLYKS